MPLLLARDESHARVQPGAESAARTLEIGLLNNLSDAGLERGDRQIIELLRHSAGPLNVRLRCFSMPSIARGPLGRAYIDARYADFTTLFSTPLHGLIVTGCEPRAHRLSDEAFWSQLSDVIDWAEHNTRSTVWSCLAAHAAVLHLDGIERKPLAKKCSGLFRVDQASTDPLLVGAATELSVPHSRWNGLDAGELEAAGYRILTQGPQVGVDTFVKRWRSLFVYLQGHPEYDGDALRREYRRDVLRYLDGTTEIYPTLPSGYFDAEYEARLLLFAACAQAYPDPKLALSFPIEPHRSSSQRQFGETLFRNWLTYIHTAVPDHVA